jgi:cell division protein FtsL
MNRTKSIFGTKNLLQKYPQAPWRSQIQILVVVFLCVIAIAVVGMFLLSVTARSSTIGREIQEIQVTISAMEIENAALNADLAYLMSYEVMQKRAARLGYDINNFEMTEYITVEGYNGPGIPRLAATTRTFDTPEENVIPAEYTESIFTWLSRKMFEKDLPVPELVP